eukprot:CAMPEP_0197522342 /NCGR_PEP_ID=MMETSP1318-20131121/7506_1 /TAXON_ID=552666 /ORGANISM="Partenskyella glossopodia, Strain RCC365" /LENGTH=159 /DNA_ID=CAMNT_0043074695 /DNA_START=3 /DNA_END=479 /DNA_ORIENTATION=-
MARVKRVTGSGRKGIKTIIKVGTDGRSYYLITKKGVRLVKNVEEAKAEPEPKESSDRMRMKELEHRNWIRFCRKKKKLTLDRMKKKQEGEPQLKRSNQSKASTTNSEEQDCDEQRAEGEEEFQTEKVTSRRWNDGRWEYLVKWKGYREKTWEPLENLSS